MSRPDINFASDDSHAFLPWVIGIMVGLASLLLCLGLTVDSWIVERHHNYENRFTVTIPASTENMDTKLKLIRSTLEGTSGVTTIDEVKDSHLQDLLRSWLGSGNSIDNLPLPRVLDIVTDSTKNIDYSDLQSKVSIIAPGTEVSTHEKWVASFSDFSAGLQTLIAILAALIISCLAITVAFTSRASLKLHSKSVGLLHSIGAEDQYIARQFQQDACWLTLRGTIPGCLAAGLVYWGTGIYMESLNSSILPSFEMNVSHAMLLTLMPAACLLVSWVSARISVLQQLHHQL